MGSPRDLIENPWQAGREGRHQEAERGLRHAISGCREEAGQRVEPIRALQALAHVLRDLPG